MTFNKSTNTPGRFIQIFEAGNFEVFRLKLPIDFPAAPNELSVISKIGIVDAEMRMLHTLDSNGARIPVLSMRLPKQTKEFKVRRGSETLARMTPSLYRQLVAERDFAMVNPSIDGAFNAWAKKHNQSIEKRFESMNDFNLNPLFSIIVPLFETPIPYFHDMIRSVLAQTYSNWELILVNASPDSKELARAIDEYVDPRIRVIKLEKNYGIARNTNEGIRAAQGDYISFFDHDDMLDPHILSFYVDACNETPDIDLIYCDEDNFHESLGDRYSPLLKPDFNLDLLYSHNYVVHMLTVSQWALSQVELSPDSTSGAQDYDLTLKIAEVARNIKHIPYILYHWRAHAGSTNGGVMSSKPYAIAASIEALDSHFERRGIKVRVSASNITCVFEERYSCNLCAIDVLSPSAPHDQLNNLRNHLTSISNEKMIRIGSISNSLEACLSDASPYTLICDPSVRFAQHEALEMLAGCLVRAEVGIAAPKLFYLDHLTQHAGVVIDEHNKPQFLNQNFVAHMGGGYHGYSECSCNYPAVGPDCLLVRTELLYRYLDEINPLLSEPINHANNEPSRLSLELILGLCEKACELGYLVTVLPTVEATVDAPILWSGCGAEQAYPSICTDAKAENNFLREEACPKIASILANPNISFASGYPQLKLVRNKDAIVKRMIRGSKYAGIIQPIKRLLKH